MIEKGEVLAAKPPRQAAERMKVCGIVTSPTLRFRGRQRLVEIGRDPGEVADDDAPQKAAFLVFVVQGLNILAKTKPERRVLGGVVDDALKALVIPESRTRKQQRLPASGLQHCRGTLNTRS